MIYSVLFSAIVDKLLYVDMGRAYVYKKLLERAFVSVVWDNGSQMCICFCRLCE